MPGRRAVLQRQVGIYLCSRFAPFCKLTGKLDNRNSPVQQSRRTEKNLKMDNQQTTALAAESAPESKPESKPEPILEPKRVYALAMLSLAAGLAIGYVLHGVGPAAQPQPVALPAKPALPASPHGNAANGHMPTTDEMRQMADKKAAPLKVKLKADPRNPQLLAQVGAIYHSANQFEQAIGYYSQAVQADPKNPALRIKLASSLFRDGDADSAIAQLNACLKIDPANANALFDLGVIRLQGKQDAKGAVAAWRQLLKSNPDLAPERKAAVEKMLAQVSANPSVTSATVKGAETHDGAK